MSLHICPASAPSICSQTVGAVTRLAGRLAIYAGLPILVTLRIHSTIREAPERAIHGTHRRVANREDRVRGVLA
jgi:hypothetical protein